VADRFCPPIKELATPRKVLTDASIQVAARGVSGSALEVGGKPTRSLPRGFVPLPHTGCGTITNGQAAQALRVKIVACTQPRSCSRFRVAFR
jgi:hypothetical protein